MMMLSRSASRADVVVRDTGALGAAYYGRLAVWTHSCFFFLRDIGALAAAYYGRLAVWTHFCFLLQGWAPPL